MSSAQGASAPRIAVFCVGNKLMLDDGVGPEVYAQIMSTYDLPDNVDLFDLGCMSLNMIDYVSEYDAIVTVDALDSTGSPAGTVFEFDPDAMARHSGAMASLHDLKLIDLFDAASLLGYEADGKCFGMQIENSSPEVITVGLTEDVHKAIPRLVDAVLAYLVGLGAKVTFKDTGEAVDGSRLHEMRDTDDFDLQDPNL